MTERVEANGLSVARVLHDFVDTEVLPGTSVDPARFWSGLAALVREHAPRNRALVARRDDLQTALDAWHRERPGPVDPAAYESFLREIGYLLPEGEDFSVGTENVDPEIAEVAGPQLVVPVTNARYALNAANARWGSLYDALYGTDALAPEGPPAGGFDPAHAAKVVAWARAFLDVVAPLAEGSHADAAGYAVQDGALVVALAGGGETPLADPARFAGYRGEAASPDAVLLVNHGLHVEVIVDRAHFLGRDDPAGVADLIVEAALTTIVDFEDSVATVDAADKVAAYRNWLGLMTGDLEAAFEKAGERVTRRLASDRVYTAPDGGERVLHGRSLMLVRNVGHLMTTDAVRDGDGRPVPECLLDAMVNAAVALHDIGPGGRRGNSRAGSVYVVVPKLHGAEETALTAAVFASVEEALGLPRNTLKMGIMDEERRTTVNLKECIRAARERVVFINTGFLDRTGDEIRTSTEAGAMVRKADMRATHWIAGTSTSASPAA